MGMFSWNCKGCGDELVCPESVRIDDHVGTYNGYGVVVMAMPANLPVRPAHREEWDVYDRKNPNETFTRAPNAWHQDCYQRHFDGQCDCGGACLSPSERAPNQGFGAAQERFLPAEDMQTEAWKAEFEWKLDDDGADEEDEEDEW